MKTKALVSTLMVVIGCAMTGVLLHHPAQPKDVSNGPPSTVRPAEPPSSSTVVKLSPAIPIDQPPDQFPERTAAVDMAEPGHENRVPPSQTTAQLAVTNEPSPQTVTNAQAQAGRPRRQLQDPVARVALAYVGEDLEAEDYWMEAIFDSSLPDGERDDLMEDLNEVGFPDPHHPGPEDVPLILNRIRIIEEVAPYADDFMQIHLAEAYKDLVNMYYGQGPQ